MHTKESLYRGNVVKYATSEGWQWGDSGSKSSGPGTGAASAQNDLPCWLRPTVQECEDQDGTNARTGESETD